MLSDRSRFSRIRGRFGPSARVRTESTEAASAARKAAPSFLIRPTSSVPTACPVASRVECRSSVMATWVAILSVDLGSTIGTFQFSRISSSLRASLCNSRLASLTPSTTSNSSVRVLLRVPQGLAATSDKLLQTPLRRPQPHTIADRG